MSNVDQVIIICYYNKYENIGGADMDDDILNLEQAMELFGVSERTMIKLLREEHIPARKIGREWRFNKTALLKWLGEGDSTNYLNQTELYRIANDTRLSKQDILEQIKGDVEMLTINGANVRELLPDLNKDVFLPDDATLRVSYKRQRGIEKLTFKVFWLIKD